VGYRISDLPPEKAKAYRKHVERLAKEAEERANAKPEDES
jgi:hypothetical protein